MRTTQRDKPVAPTASSPDRQAREAAEDIHVRNYDVERTYDLAVSVRDGEETVWSRHYTLPPGQSRSETGLLDEGAYDIAAVLDPVRGTTARCRLDAGSDRAALVEVGNGVVSVSEGLY